MDWNKVFGVLLIGFGIFTFYARGRHPGMFWKLKPMQERWGQGPGKALHVFGYSVVPILLGIAMLLGYRLS